MHCSETKYSRVSNLLKKQFNLNDQRFQKFSKHFQKLWFWLYHDIDDNTEPSFEDFLPPLHTFTITLSHQTTSLCTDSYINISSDKCLPSVISSKSTSFSFSHKPHVAVQSAWIISVPQASMINKIYLQCCFCFWSLLCHSESYYYFYIADKT